MNWDLNGKSTMALPAVNPSWVSLMNNVVRGIDDSDFKAPQALRPALKLCRLLASRSKALITVVHAMESICLLNTAIGEELHWLIRSRKIISVNGQERE